MPWEIRKRACKQVSTGKTGTAAIVKISSDGSEEQVSCHLSIEKARSAIRAKHANEVLGVQSTPTFFVEGKKIPGNMPFDDFKDVLDKALAK